MKYIPFCILLLVLLSSCMTNTGTSSNNQSDTTKAVEVAVRTALQSSREDFDSVRAQFQARDTIYMTTDSLPLTELPEKIDSTPLRVLDHTALCANDTLPESSRDYIYIRAFQKNDTGYYVSVQSLNCQRATNGEALGVFIAKRKTKGGN